jgi:hypothetical protein
MNERSAREALRVAIEKRILNEFAAKILNEERLDRVVLSRKTAHAADYMDVTFHCECDDGECGEIISMSTEEYQRTHLRTKYFVVIPSHVRLDIEEVINSYKHYALVAKFFPHPGRA